MGGSQNEVFRVQGSGIRASHIWGGGSQNEGYCCIEGRGVGVEGGSSV